MRLFSNLVVLRAYGDEGEPEATTPNITETPEFQEALNTKLQALLAAETGGLKTKNAELIAEKKKAQDQLTTLLGKAQDDQDAADLKAGKLDVNTYADRRVQAAAGTYQARIDAIEAEKGELSKALEGERNRFKRAQINQLVGNEALKNEFFQPSAAEDLAELAGKTWDLSDDGELISRDKAGNVALGKGGKPLTPKEWIESLAQTRPHYFKNVVGSGGKQGLGVAGKTVSRQDWQKMVMLGTEKEQAELFAKRTSGEIVVS